MQAMLRASVQKVGSVRGPLCFAKERRLALIKVPAKVSSKISAGAGRTQQLSCARPVQPGAVMNQCLGKSGVVACEIHHEIGESARNVPAGKRRVGGPGGLHPWEPGGQT